MDGVADHEGVRAAAVDLHVQDAHLLLALHDLRPHVLVHLAIAPDHLRVVEQFEGLTVSFHINKLIQTRCPVEEIPPDKLPEAAEAGFVGEEAELPTGTKNAPSKAPTSFMFSGSIPSMEI